MKGRQLTTRGLANGVVRNRCCVPVSALLVVAAMKQRQNHSAIAVSTKQARELASAAMQISTEKIEQIIGTQNTDAWKNPRQNPDAGEHSEYFQAENDGRGSVSTKYRASDGIHKTRRELK